nr:ribulokinase [bacterium]
MRYTIGVDFGTLSARALVLDIESGREVAVAARDYAHGVMDRELPGGIPLGPDWALQQPADYLQTMEGAVGEALRLSAIDPQQVIGLGIDFTACTMLPTLSDGTPLCWQEGWRDHPHAYVKLWKHHAASRHAARLNQLARERGEGWLARYGGAISSEWMFAKIYQIADEAPEVYRAAERFIEAGDWVIWQLTGRETRSACQAGYKAIWSADEGYPSEAFFAALHPLMEHVIQDKMCGPILPLGDCAGGLTAAFAKKLGLREGTPVAVSNVDAHVTVPAAGLTGAGDMLMIMGTSTCHMLVGEEEKPVPGICGVVRGGILPGLPGYEAGQSCVGDHFDWVSKSLVPPQYHHQAQEKGITLQQLLTEKAARLLPGQSGLLALDWWNGNRSVLVDVDLTGLILGMTLATKAEDIYRAIIEATAYGTRMIVETFQQNGVPVKRLVAAGGIAEKNALAMQIYADVMNMPIYLAGSPQAPARGAAMFGAVAAGQAAGGFSDIVLAAEKLGRIKEKIYTPVPEHVAVYDKLYREYAALHDTFGRGGNHCMKRLKALRAQAIDRANGMAQP